MSATDNQHIVIIGGGQAGGTCAAELAKRGFAGSITLITDEPHIPYKRPPLSKTYFAGEASLESLYVMKPAKLEQAGIDCHTSTHVDAIDRDSKTLQLSDGTSLAYDKLVLATGGRPRPLPIPGADADNVFLVRTIDDIDRIKKLAHADSHVAIVGGGFIGLEVTAVCVKLGLKVTLLEGLPRVLSRVTTETISSFFESMHRDAGVDVQTGVGVAAFERSGAGTDVVLSNSERVAVDFVIVGIGMLPNVELAEGAGLEVDNGIVVDEFTRTSDNDIYAIGDCTNHPNKLLGSRIRLESVQNAMEQGRIAARNLCGEEVVYDSLPWFWSDQYDVKLQMAGTSAGHDDSVQRGDPQQSSFALFYLRNGEMIGVDAVSRPKDFLMAKKLIAGRCTPDPQRLADENVPLKELL